jgi:hypothetical protein
MDPWARNCGRKLLSTEITFGDSQASIPLHNYALADLLTEKFTAIRLTMPHDPYVHYKENWLECLQWTANGLRDGWCRNLDPLTASDAGCRRLSSPTANTQWFTTYRGI